MVALAEWIESEQTAPAAKNRVGDFFGSDPARVGELASQVADTHREKSSRRYDSRLGYVLDQKDNDDCPKFSRIGMAGDNANAWKRRMGRRAAKWDSHYEKYGDLIEQVAGGDYEYAPHPSRWVSRPSIGRREPASYWQVNGSWLGNTIDSMRASVWKSAGGNYQVGDMMDDPTAGPNMNQNRTARINRGMGRGMAIAKLGQHLLGAHNQYTIGWSNSGDGFFVASSYANGGYIGNQSLHVRYRNEQVGRQIIDDVARGYESLSNPYRDKIDRCTKKWRADPSSQYR